MASEVDQPTDSRHATAVADAGRDSIQGLPEVPDDGVLIKTLYAGVCNVEHSLHDKLDTSSYIGHEVCGKVLSVGSKVPNDKGPSVGDVVVVYPWPGCGKCETCSAENWQLCDEQNSAAELSASETCASRGNQRRSASFDNFQRVYASWHHLANDGDLKTADRLFELVVGLYASGLFSFSVEAISPWRRAVSLPQDCGMTPQLGCLLPCDALRVYSALKDARACFDTAVRVRGFANLLVVSGHQINGLELWTVSLIKNVLCDPNVKVVCASRRRDVVDRALAAGADDAVQLPADATISQLTDAATMSGYNRIDVSFDVAGDPASLAVAVRSLHRGGTLFQLATPSQSTTSDVQLSVSELVRRGVTLRPVLAGSLAQLQELVDVLAVQRLCVDVAVECCQVDELAAALQRLHERHTSGRLVVKYD